MHQGKQFDGIVRDQYLYDPDLFVIPDSKVHGANMGPTWVLSAPDGPHVDPMNLAIRDILQGHLLPTQIDLNPSMNRYSHPSKM